MPPTGPSYVKKSEGLWKLSLQDWPSDLTLKQEAHPKHPKDPDKKVNERKWNPTPQKSLRRKPKEVNQPDQPTACGKNCLSQYINPQKLEKPCQKLTFLRREEKHAPKTQVPVPKFVEKVAKT